MIPAAFLDAVRASWPALRWQTDAPMSRLTTLRVGGPADCLAEPGDTETLRGLLALAQTHGVPVTVIGNGSNLLVRDGGIRGLVVRFGGAFSACGVSGSVLTAQSGILLKDLAQRALAAGLSGLEFAAGIPGTLGGALVMNAGAYGGEMSQVVESADVLCNGTADTLPVSALALGYRSSRLQATGELALGARLRLTPDDPERIRARMNDLQARRREKQPLNLPSAGSFFKRPEGAYAAQLIEQAGLKGRRVGGAMVSEKHAGFLVNAGGATARDFLRLMAEVQDAVRSSSGFALVPEVRIVGEDPDGGIL